MKVGEVQEASGTKAATAETGEDCTRRLLEASRRKREEVAKAIVECSVEKQIAALTVVSETCAFTKDSVAKLQGDGDLACKDGEEYLAKMVAALGVLREP